MINTVRRKNINNDDERRKTLGKWVREQRLAKGYTLRDMSVISGKAHSYFGKIENAQRGLDLLEYIDICRWLNISPTQSLMYLERLITQQL